MQRPSPVPRATRQQMTENHHTTGPVLELGSFLLRWLRLQWEWQPTSCPHWDNSQCRPLACGVWSKHTSVYTRLTYLLSPSQAQSQSPSLSCGSRVLQRPHCNAPVAASEYSIPPTSGSTWELNSAEVSRVNKWPWVKIVLEVCHRAGKETRRQGDSLQMEAPNPNAHFCPNMRPNRHRANCPLLKASKSGCQRISRGSQKDLVCHSPLL